MSFIGEEGVGRRSTTGREGEVRKRLEEGRRVDEDRRKDGDDGGQRERKGRGRSTRSQLGDNRCDQKSGSDSLRKINCGESEKLCGRELSKRKDDKNVTGGEERLRRVPYLQVSNQAG